MAEDKYDVIVVGAGLGGIRAVHSFREAGFKVVGLEAAGGPGGVWYWNRYPGARCDVESFDYSYSFSKDLEQEWRWSERYATQPEILRYVNHVVERFDLASLFRFDTRVMSLTWSDSRAEWTVVTEQGQTFVGQHVILATGQLSTTKAPQIEGVDDFEGRILHTGEWPHEQVDFSGERVGVIGTGSSGVQLVPIVAQAADELKVFQRTPTFTVPANNRPISDEEDARVKAHYESRRETARMSPSGLGFDPGKVSALEVSDEVFRARMEEQYAEAGFGFALAFRDLLIDQEANDRAAAFLREKIREKVTDPDIAEKLTPRGYPFGAKRPAVDSGYYEAFNRDNVELVDISETPIERITAKGIVTGGIEHGLDTIVFATGFDALTGSLLRPTITGRGGITLREKWSAGPVTYLGLGTHGFPNLFIICGPGSPSVLANVILGIEQHVDWLVDLLVAARKDDVAEIEATALAEKEWVEHVNQRAEETLYPKAASWYLGAEVPGKPRVFMPYSGGIRGYRRICNQVAAAGYQGFAMTPRQNAARQPVDHLSRRMCVGLPKEEQP